MRGLTCKLLVTCTGKDVNAYNANDVFICFQPWPAAQTRWREVAGHRTWSRGVTAPTARSVAAALVFSLSERTLQRRYDLSLLDYFIIRARSPKLPSSKYTAAFCVGPRVHAKEDLLPYLLCFGWANGLPGRSSSVRQVITNGIAH